MEMKYRVILRYQSFCMLFNFYIYIMEVGNKLSPQRPYRQGFALKGIQQHIIKINNPSTIGPDELLTVRFPDLKKKSGDCSRNHEINFQYFSIGYRH